MNGRGKPALSKGRLHSHDTGVTEKVWLIVRDLRRQGRRVFVAQRDERGCETHHVVDGVIVPTTWLIDTMPHGPAKQKPRIKRAEGAHA